MKKWYILLFSILLLLGFVACGKNSASGMAADSQAADKASYQTITQEKAKELMDTQEVLILDVREQSEYDSGHIPNAVLLPVGQIDEKRQSRSFLQRMPWCWSIAAVETAAKRRPARWRSWGIPRSMSLGASTAGPMRWSDNTSRNALRGVFLWREKLHP